MPILPAEPDLFPPDLWKRGAAPSDPDARWWCLHTKPRQEKAAARHLRSRRIPHYLPQVVREDRTPGGRKIRPVLPLFPGYLFLLGEEGDRLEALRSNHLANVLEVVDQEGFDHDLRQIYQMLASGVPVVPEPSHPVGTRVRITSGPLNGLVGAVVRRGKRDHFVAVVEFLGSGAMVELQDWQVERVDDPDERPGRGPQPATSQGFRRSPTHARL